MSDNETFNLTTKPSEKIGILAPTPLPGIKPYDPTEDQERIRGVIALALVGLLAALAVISLAMLQFGGAQVGDVKTLLDVLVGPIVGLVGTVTGFYFGQKSRSD